MSFVSFPVPRVNRAHALTESSQGQTVPLWEGTATAFGSTYPYIMVGANPFAADANPNPTIEVDLVPIKLEFLGPSGQVVHTFDADAPNPDCGLISSPTQLALQSPIFQSRDYVTSGTNVGTVQYESAFMREEFATRALGPNAPNSGYGITLHAVSRPELTVQVPAGVGWKLIPASATGVCGGRPGGNIGEINVQSWDGFIRQSLIPQLQARGETTSTHLLDFLLGSVIWYVDAKTQAAGYHSGASTPAGVQYYVQEMYGTPGMPNGASDIAPMSHEIGEWTNDPNATNPTPAWGHLPVVPACQGNLEVGDPLTGKTIPVTMPNGVTYHPQELAFASWFFRQRTSTGINGWYSSNGSFTGSQPVCGP